MRNTGNTIRVGCIYAAVFLSSAPSLAQFELRSDRSLAEVLSEQPEPLPLEQAFPFFVRTTSPGIYRITWEPASDHYLYQHAFHFAQTEANATDEIEVRYSLPEGLSKADKFFGDIVAYYDPVSVELQLTTVPGPDSALVIEYQGCADWGFCYPPQKMHFPLAP
tara:strand:- start:428 stop:919 length:492 start_codon:yes stop_codon:yes gene_type:complete